MTRLISRCSKIRSIRTMLGRRTTTKEEHYHSILKDLFLWFSFFDFDTSKRWCKSVKLWRGMHWSVSINHCKKMKRQQSKFPRCLPDARLGIKHKNLDSFRDATQQHGQCVRESNEYSLVVVTEANQQSQKQNTRILLGMRKRSNGESGFYNPFGGAKRRCLR